MNGVKKKITIYQKPSCSTCRKVFAILKSKPDVDMESINYFIDPIPKKKIEELLFKMKMSAAELLRKSEPLYQGLGLGEKKYSEEYLIDLMVSHPDLMQRPIVERGGKAILARPPERIKELL